MIFREVDKLTKLELFEKVYDIVAQIPKGNVMTYSQIGLILGSRYYARRVGQAMSHAPEHLHLPCHRVVNSKGELAPEHVFGGQMAQRDMLLAEGVIFKENGNINLKESILQFFVD